MVLLQCLIGLSLHLKYIKISHFRTFLFSFSVVIHFHEALKISYQYFSYVKLLDKRFIGCAKTSLSERQTSRYKICVVANPRWIWQSIMILLSTVEVKSQSAVPVWGTWNSCDAEYHQQAEISKNPMRRTINHEKNVYKLSRRRFNKRSNDDAQYRQKHGLQLASKRHIKEHKSRKTIQNP